MTDQIIEPGDDDEFARAADQIIAKRGAAKLKPPPPPPEPRGPAWHEVAERDDTTAIAFAKGVEAGREAVARCCGCAGDDVTNPYDGSTLS